MTPETAADIAVLFLIGVEVGLVLGFLIAGIHERCDR